MTSANAVPPPLTNVLAPLSGEHKAVFDEMLDGYLQLFGIAVSSKQHAAARLSGILVIAAAMGELPYSIVFRKTMDLPQEFWESGAIWNALYLDVVIDLKTDSFSLLKAALHLQGGIAGEFYSNLNYPTSLLEDLYINSICVSFLSLKHNVDPNTLATRLAYKATEIIETSKDVYSKLYKIFGLEDGLSVSEVRKILAEVPLTELNSLLSRSQ